jgi:hypothetical protein
MEVVAVERNEVESDGVEVVVELRPLLLLEEAEGVVVPEE